MDAKTDRLVPLAGTANQSNVIVDASQVLNSVDLGGATNVTITLGRDDQGKPACVLMLNAPRRLDDARRMFSARAVQADADRVRADGQALAHRKGIGLDLALETVAGRLGKEHDRAGRMALRKPREDVLGRLDPFLRHPSDVRHHVRAQAGPLIAEAERGELALDRRDRV